METLNNAKDAAKDEIKATKDEIEYSAGYSIATEKPTDPLAQPMDQE
tara:strand:- start:255 stop:395 length:141 start_codon:yes stop_codon:yes gene_type:complete